MRAAMVSIIFDFVTIVSGGEPKLTEKGMVH